MKASVLIVDDDPTLRKLLGDRFGFWGHNVEEAATGDEALAVAPGQPFDLILLDLMLPDQSGLDVLKTLKEEGCDADIIVLTAHGSVEAAVQALRAGATDFLQKPADFALLEAAVKRSLDRRRLERANQALVDRVGPSEQVMREGSPAMQEILDMARRAALARATVLLTGESGSGKQVLAEYIHRQSPRRDGPMIYVSCVAFPETLLEAELFGCVKGAYTGAVDKKGRCELANGGTLFLDEIGDMPLPLQSKLLRFGDSGEFERLGETRTRSVDTRIIAATNRDLLATVREGRFREDLYYRLNVVAIHIPALRERSEDIPTLAEAFMNRYAGELCRGPLRLSVKTLDIMKHYAWPGNVRQLKNAVERMVVLADDDSLGPELLPPEILSSGESSNGEHRDDLTLVEAELQFRKRYLQRVMARCGGNQTRAAKILGMTRPYLNRLLKELGLRGAEEEEEADAST